MINEVKIETFNNSLGTISMRVVEAKTGRMVFGVGENEHDLKLKLVQKLSTLLYNERREASFNSDV